MIDFSLKKSLHSTHGDMWLEAAHKIPDGAFLSLYGKSGSGKTSILRMLAGLMHPEGGFIRTDDDTWFDHRKKINIIPQKRKTGFVFQDYALFPNMNVRENVGYALPKHTSKNIVEELLELTGLSVMGERKIQQLSGGQQQRVALARAVAMQPKLLLLDEPLSAIDDDLRRQLQDTLLLLHKRYFLTTILVSHDIGEIVKLSDEILHLENGSLQPYSTPAAFLKDIGYAAGLSGIIVAAGDQNISVFLRQSVVTIPITQQNQEDYTKGAAVEILYDDNLKPIIRMV